MPESPEIYVIISSRNGDRLGNILRAQQFLQIKASIVKTSSFFEAPAPSSHINILNRVCAITTDLAPLELFQYLKWIEKRIAGEKESNGTRKTIELDILLFKNIVHEENGLTIPHPRLPDSVSILAPLAEIAPRLRIHPESDITVEQRLLAVGSNGTCKLDHATPLNLADDTQQARPAVTMSLSRVGVANLSRIIYISYQGKVIPFQAELDIFADLHSDQAGVHMSRFSNDLEEIVQEFSDEPSPDIESLAERLASQVLESQQAVYSEVHIRGRTALRKTTPVSEKQVHDVFTLIGIAAATKDQVKRLVGVETEGMTACPCAQKMMRNHYHHILQSEGYTKEQADHILTVLPAPSHNQRGRGTLMVGTETGIQAEHLVHIVEASMSSEIYELLKRPDEFMIVNKAHRNPRFVEDVVREMLRNVVDLFTFLPDASFVLAKQVNYEGIHKHDAYAERYGLLGEIRREMKNGQAWSKHMALQDWLRN